MKKVAVKASKTAKVQPKHIEESEEEEEEEKPKSKKVKTPVQQPMVDEADEEGEFEVCVKGLSFQVYEDDIKQLFEPFGDVLNIKLLYRPDGKSKGIAFVKFGKKSAFNKALELNETEQFGRNINVEQAQGAKSNNNAGGFNKGGNFNNGGGFKKQNNYQDQGNAEITTNTLFIGGLSYNSTVESIQDYFSQSGNVQRARIVTDKETGKVNYWFIQPRGFGYVEFGDVESAKKAYASLNSGYLDGRQIRLDSAAERPPRDGNFGGGQGGFGGRGAPRNPGNSRVDLSQDDKLAKKGAIGTFQGKKMALWMLYWSFSILFNQILLFLTIYSILIMTLAVDNNKDV